MRVHTLVRLFQPFHTSGLIIILETWSLNELCRLSQMRRKETGCSLLGFFFPLHRKRDNIQSEWFTASSNWKLRKGLWLESVRKLSSDEMHLRNLVLASSFRKKRRKKKELPTVGISRLKMCPPQERIYPPPKIGEEKVTYGLASP